MRQPSQKFATVEICGSLSSITKSIQALINFKHWLIPCIFVQVCVPAKVCREPVANFCEDS